MHVTQRRIIDSLRSSRAKTFSVLQSDVAETSDNLTYHLQKLIESGYIESPNKGLYKLAVAGLVYLNNNYDLENHVFPTVSCMIILQNAKGDYLLMQKQKQPFLGALHFLTFGVTSEKSLVEQMTTFFELYQIKAKAMEFKQVFRKLGQKDSESSFDKFFMIYTGKLESFEPIISERHFIIMSKNQISSDVSVISPTLEVLKALEGPAYYNEQTFDEAS